MNIKIEKGIPRKQRGELSAALRICEPGDSFLIRGSSRPTIHSIAARMGIAISVSSINTKAAPVPEGCMRVWRIK